MEKQVKMRAEDDTGRAAVFKLDKIIKHNNWTWREWFDKVDASDSSGFRNDRISSLDLKEKLVAKTRKNPKDRKFSLKDLENLMGYMDPDHNDSLDFDEISEAVENAHNDSAEAKSDREVGVLISEVHRYMSRRRWKLINIHKQLDFDERGKIMVSDLR